MSESLSSEYSGVFTKQEMDEYKIAFDEFDANKNEILEMHELTELLHKYKYNYNASFFIEAGKMIFENEFENKNGLFNFDDFIDYLTELEPVHEKVLQTITQKLNKLNLNWNKDSSQFLDLLPLIKFENEKFNFENLDEYLSTILVSTKIKENTIANNKNNDNIPENIDTNTNTNENESKMEIETEVHEEERFNQMTTTSNDNNKSFFAQQIVEQQTQVNNPIDEDDEQYCEFMWTILLKWFGKSESDHTLNINETRKSLRALGINDITKTQFDTIMQTIDANKSGTIDYGEFKTCYLQLFNQKIKHGIDIEHVRYIFDDLDTQCSGYLDINHFVFGILKIAPNMNPMDCNYIFNVISNGTHCIELDEFYNFIQNTSHPKTIKCLKKIMRCAILNPVDHLKIFQDFPDFFRVSYLYNISKKEYNNQISLKILPQRDQTGISLENVQINPENLKIVNKNKPTNMENIREFKIFDVSGVPLPSKIGLNKIQNRKVRIGLFLNNKCISNILTIPVIWKKQEEDQWLFGNIFKEFNSNSLNSWNIFVLNLPENTTKQEKLYLLFEFCLEVQINDNNNENNEIINTTEISCAWTKLSLMPILNADKNDKTLDVKINKKYKLPLYGGTTNIEEHSIESMYIHNNNNESSLSLRKCQQFLTGIKSELILYEKSYGAINNTKLKEHLIWLPNNILLPYNSMRIIKLYFELIGDDFIRNQPQFYIPNEQHLYETILLYIINKPNILSTLIDEWNIERKKIKKSLRKDTIHGTNELIKNKFRQTLTKFLPIIIHKTINDDIYYEINKKRISFIKSMLMGNPESTLKGKKPSPTVPIIFEPFTTQMFVC